ncbi:MAG: class I SAM-dependent methyltransferase [Bryobacteraceae bacterium]
MHEILTVLPGGSRVLDLGSGSGSFDASQLACNVVRADLDVPAPVPNAFVRCSASELPFANASFQALVLNHSLEHLENLPQCVTEMARVLAPGARLYIAVPDASTLTDRLYRWLARGGGHVNLFTDPDTVVRMITDATGLPHAGTRVLYTSLSFANRFNLKSRPPGKLLLLANGNETFLRVLNWALRKLDRWLGLRTSAYGWAFYFGELPSDADLEAWSNVCVRCGSGHASATLKAEGRVTERRFLPSVYRCPHCRTANFFFEDVWGRG